VIRFDLPSQAQKGPELPPKKHISPGELTPRADAYGLAWLALVGCGVKVSVSLKTQVLRAPVLPQHRLGNLKC